MNRRTVLAIVVAAFGVLAVAVAAATLEGRWEPEDPGSGGMGTQPGYETEAEDAVSQLVAIPYVEEIFMGLILLVVILGAIFVITQYREAIPVLLAVVVITALLFLFVEGFVPDDLGGDSEPEEMEVGNFTEGEDGEPAAPDATVDWMPILALFGVFGMVLIAAIAMSLRGGSAVLAVDDEDAAGEGTDPGAVAADIGAAAGRAADRIEARDAYENEVYRAWAEMTALLELDDPDVATPGDFASKAIEVGLAPADVRDLTQLFEAVRYGNRTPTPERERRAVDLLRRIESRYGGAE